MQIKRFENTMGDSTFYALMGKYFAESKYKKEIPYLNNQEGNVWFVALDNETKTKVILKHDYVEEAYRGKKLFDKLNKERMSYISKVKKPFEIAVRETQLIKYWVNKGFKPFRTGGSYTYLRKEATEQ